MQRYRNYLVVLPILAVTVLVTLGLQNFLDRYTTVFVYMLAVVISAFFLDFGPALLTSLVSAALLDFINLPPHLSFTRTPADYGVSIAVMLVTAGTISRLAKRLRQQASEAGDRETRSTAMYALISEIAAAGSREEIISLTLQHVSDAVYGSARLLSPEEAARDPRPNGSVTLLPDGRRRLTGILRIGTGDWLSIEAAGDADKADPRQFRAMLEQSSLALERLALLKRIVATELKEKEQVMRTNMLNAVSHDLRTPLASIIGAASSLLERGDSLSPEGRRQMRQIILDEARHMQGMVENLLDMARMQNRSLQENADWQAMEEIVAGAVTILRRRIKDHLLRVVAPDNLPLIRCDGFLLERVIVNLVENAARYSPAGSLIEISASLATPFLELSVRDNGPGIPEDQREAIFEPFHRLDKTSGSGLGLGLTICRAIINAHLGQIRIESPPRGGTMVVIRLPLPAMDTPAPSEPPLSTGEPTR